MKLWTINGEWEVPQDLLDSYMILHRDADKQFAQMQIWLTMNKSRRPKNPERFIANWFQKNQRFQHWKNEPLRPQSAADRNIAAIASLTGAKHDQTVTIAARLGS
jgi:hypothetical protein